MDSTNFFTDDPEARMLTECNITSYCNAADEIRRLSASVRVALGTGDDNGCVFSDPKNCIPNVLRKKFGYKVDVFSIQGSPLTLTDDQQALLQTSLKDKYPVLVVGNGHAWVLDNYKSDNGGMYHVLNFHGPKLYSNSAVSYWITNPARDGTQYHSKTFIYNIRPGFSDLVGGLNPKRPRDSADVPLRSDYVKKLLKWIEANPGQDPGVDLRTGGSNRPVGFTHYIELPAGAIITSAKIKFRVVGTDSLVYNDSIIFDESKTDSLVDPYCQPGPNGEDYELGSTQEGKCAIKSFAPIIALRDLLPNGKEPVTGQVIEAEINLAKVPVRTKVADLGPGSEWPPKPDAYDNYLKSLEDREFNMIFGDDVQVDYSQLTVTYRLPSDKPGDLNGDGIANAQDVQLITSAVGTKAYTHTYVDAEGNQATMQDPRDIDYDKNITVRDARLLALCIAGNNCSP